LAFITLWLGITLKGENSIVAILNFVFALLNSVSILSILEETETLYKLFIQLITKFSTIILSNIKKLVISITYEAILNNLFLGSFCLENNMIAEKYRPILYMILFCLLIITFKFIFLFVVVLIFNQSICFSFL
jgi:hypothetical protein